MVSAEYTLAELAAAAGMTMRNVRAYRTRGVLGAPRIRGRTGYYGPEHLAQLRNAQALLARGLTLGEVAATLSGQPDDLGEQVRELMLTEPAEASRGDELGELLDSTVQTLAMQRPGITARLLDLGVLQRGRGGRLMVDAGLLARANDLLADGTRVRVCADIGELAGLAGREVAGGLVQIAAAAGGRDARTYLDLATWAFRDALRHELARQVSGD
jgi:DNA-binding transcriptional MerR regulator